MLRLKWLFLVLFAVPVGLSFVPGLPTHGYGHVWYGLLPLFWWREPAQRKRLAWFAAALAVQTLAFPDIDLGFLGWVVLVPYLVAREQKDGAVWWRAAWLYGFLRAHAGFYWLGSIHFTAWWAVSVGSGFLFAFVFDQIVRKARFLPYAFRVATGWVCFEWVHSWFLGGFPWLLLSHTQYRYGPVIQVADVVGAYGLSFAMAYVQAAALRVRAGGREPAVAGLLLGATLLYGLLRTGPEADAGARPTVLMVQSATPHAVKENRLKSEEDQWLGLMRLTRQGLAAHPDAALVVWPETMHPWFLIEDDPYRSREFLSHVHEFVRRFRKPLIAGANTYADVERLKRFRGHNSAVLVDPEGNVTGVYEKKRLVPMGEEFLPRRVFPESWCDTWFDWLARTIGYPRSCDLEAGEGFRTLDAGPGLRCAPLICFEGLYASDGRNAAATDEPDLLLHLVNNGWFGDTYEQRQCVASWVFRAVETRTPFLSCANAGVTCAVAPSGEILATLDKVFETGFLAVPVPPRWPASPFSKGGWWLFAAALGVAVLACLQRARRRGP